MLGAIERFFIIGLFKSRTKGEIVVVKPMKMFSMALLLGVCSTSLSACHRVIDFGDAGRIEAPEELLRLVTLAESLQQSVDGEAKLRMESPQTKGVVTLFVAVSAPSSMHLESLNFFGKPSAVLVSDGVRFSMHEVEQGQYFYGPATSETVSRFLPLKLSPTEWVNLFLGRAPRLENAVASLEFDEARQTYRLTLRQGQNEQRLWVHPKYHRVVKSESIGDVAYTVDFEDMVFEEAVTWPRRIRVAIPSAMTHAELRFHEVTLNSGMDASLFEFNPPANVPSFEVDGTGNIVAKGP